MTAPPQVDYVARVQLPVPLTTITSAPGPLTWFVTFGSGKPAQNTYTEVVFDPACVDPLQTHLTGRQIVAVLDEVTRRVAFDLYGTAWSFTYPPNEYEDAVARWDLTRREVVVVSSVTVYDLTPREDRP